VDETNSWFRIKAILEIAIHETDDSSPESGEIRGRSHLERARALTNRLWTQSDIREALGAIVEALTALENELRHLQHEAQLEAIGVQLRKELVNFGADGMSVQHTSSLPLGSEALVYLVLPARGMHHLLVLRATVHSITPDNEVEYKWINLPNDLKDLLVGFVFQQQGKERRRALDATN
jgi:hypothetical protein